MDRAFAGLPLISKPATRASGVGNPAFVLNRLTEETQASSFPLRFILLSYVFLSSIRH
jgi:hypothetical protein